MSAPALLVLSFASIILAGTLGMWLLPGLVTGEPLSLLDALFTVTSAVCVAGLSVVNVATGFTTAGQLYLLLLVQLGGLGLVTLTTLVIGALGQQLSLRSEMLTVAVSELRRSNEQVPRLAWRVARALFAFEAAGALILWVLWWPQFGAADALWHAVFHAVNAVCNGGLSTFPDSLMGHSREPLTLFVISLLAIVGSVGYLSGEEWLRWWRSGGKRGSRRLSSHTFGALVVTAVLLLGGFVLFALFEWRAALDGLTPVQKLANAFLMSVASRSSGFNSVSYADVTNSTAFLTILLMVVGGLPGSTAGGLRTTTVAVLLALALSRLKGRRYVALHGRTVPDGTVARTVSVTLLAFTVMTVGVFLFSYTEARGASVSEARASFLPMFFEVVSAFSTAGLTMDQTPLVTDAGRLLLVVLMFVGRVGLLSFFAALALRSRGALRDFRPAHEDLIVG